MISRTCGSALRTAGIVHLALVVSGLILLSERASAQPGTPSPEWGAGVERPDWDQLAPSQVATIRTRPAAGFLALIPASLLFVLYIYRPRPYLLAWIGAWLMTALMTNLAAVASDLVRSASGLDPPNLAAQLLVVVSQSAGIVGPALIWLGVRWVRAPLATPAWLPATLLALMSALAMLTAFNGIRAVLIVGTAVIACMFTCAAVESLLEARRTRRLAAAVLGIGLTAVAATDVSASALVALGQAGVELPNRLIIVNTLWGLVVVIGMFLVVFDDMMQELRQTNVELAFAQSELEALAATDPLTGCFNRRFFDEVVARELRQHRRFGIPLSVLFVDVDRFKTVNDQCGHDTGDRVLCAVADVLKGCVREADYVFRWGGDEFVVLLSCEEPQAGVKAGDVRDAFAALPLLTELPPGIALSVGWIGVPSDATDVLPFIQAADQRMYAQKRQTA